MTLKMVHRALPRLRALASETMSRTLGQVLDCCYLKALPADSQTAALIHCRKENWLEEVNCSPAKSKAQWEES